MAKKIIPTNGIVYSTDPGFKREEPESQQEELLPPARQPLRMSLDTKHRSGKAVTLIEGFAGPEEALETLGKALKTFCGTGGSVKDRQIIVQGDQRAKLKAWFEKNGYKSLKLKG
jgi:translation initiation factor 1